MADIKNIYFQMLAIVSLTMIFVMSIWCMDVSVSALLTGNGDTVTSGLLFKNVEPRITYHLGIMFLYGTWLTMCGMLTWKILKEKKVIK